MARGITDATIEEIKSRIDLADLIASYGVQVRHAGSSKMASCPFHQDKKPSFSINDAKGFYHCFSCGESGDAIKFVERMEGLSFVEAVKKLAERCGVKIEESYDPAAARRSRLFALMAELAAFYHRCLLKTREGEIARKYLASRDLGAEVQEEYLIGYAPAGAATVLKWAEKYKYTPQEMEEAGVVRLPSRPGDRGYHRFGGRLVFTIRDKQGRVVGFSGRQLVESKNSGKYLNSPETPIFKKSNVLYGFDKAARAIARSPRHEVIVCEGQIDCIRLQTCGFPNAVAGQGTAFTEEHVRMLKTLAEQVALVYDDDAAGHKATVKSARLCLAAGLPVRVVSLPGGDDPDSFLRTHPADEFRAMLDDAESIVSFQVRTARAGERNPDAVDAVNRVVHEVLATIAQCPNAVLRAGMVGEAARATGLPVVALATELEKARDRLAKAPAPRPPQGGVDVGGEPPEAEDVPDEEVVGEDASVTPPPPREMALCAFLMGNEYDETLAGMAAEFLPPQAFASEFTAGFVEAWLMEAREKSDRLRPFADGLDGHARAWFDEVLSESAKSQASEQSPTDNLQEFIRAIWSAALRRRRGGLPVTGGDASDSERLRLSVVAKQLERARWHVVKDIVRKEMQEPADGR